MKRTHYCGALRASDVGADVVLMGWVARVRDLGGLTFIDVRDREGIAQVVVRPEAGDAVVSAAKALGAEWVVAVSGKVVAREATAVNREIPTGAVEVVATDVQALSQARTPPFIPEDDTRVAEETRLKYRYIDLRRPRLQKNLFTRSALAFATRSYLGSRGFVEVETPFLTKSTPEGARDYLVPSRVHKGSFYALPQSPQLFKQLLMVSGFDRYFQIARCFRDEDLRLDRQPEFTQVDIEMSFVERDDVFTLVEGVFASMLGAIGQRAETPFPRYAWTEVMHRYGSDKPDLRFDVPIHDVSEVFAGAGYGVFDRILAAQGTVRAIVAPGCARYSRKDIEALEAFAKAEGASGLGWARSTETEIASPLAKHVGEDRLKAAFREAGGGVGDLLLLVAGRPLPASKILGALRLHLAQKESWIKSDGGWRFLWVTDFPLFEWVEDEKCWASSHHPFTAPHPDDADKIETDPGSVRSQAYDVVANGFELASGSIRIHQQELQSRIFRALRIADEEARDRFGFFLEALTYGTPPHGGIALGFDRIAMIASGGKSLRDVIAFPKTTSAFDLMTGSPGAVSEAQLRLLGIALEHE